MNNARDLDSPPSLDNFNFIGVPETAKNSTNRFEKFYYIPECHEPYSNHDSIGINPPIMLWAVFCVKKVAQFLYYKKHENQRTE